MGQVRCERTLHGIDDMGIQATSSGKRAQVNLPASVFFRSVGYKSLPLPGLKDLGIEASTVQAGQVGYERSVR
jgi:hypothetical protein